VYRRRSTIRPLLVGVCLLVVRRTFGDEIPTVTGFCEAAGLSDETVRRTARALLRPVARLLRQRRPGPRPRATPPARQQALEAINGLLHVLLAKPIPKLVRSAVTRGLLTQQVLFWRGRGVSLREMAAFLRISPKTLSRWIDRLEREGEGCLVPDKSRRPATSPNQVPGEIQEALRRLRSLFPRRPAAELTRIFNRHFLALLERHGLRPLSRKTAAKYMGGKRAKAKGPPSQRGGYDYPPPLAMAWIDTTLFRIAGLRLHIIVAMEASSRLVLAGDAFLQENSEITAVVLAEALTRAPGLRAVVRDRGTPYLNRHINALLAEQTCLPIDAHPHFPIDKAALERFFGTAKPWLRAALARLEDGWKQERAPAEREIASAVRAALQVFLRAYSLIPQPYLENKCPFERLEAALRTAGAREDDLDRFHRLAREREDKDSLLREIAGGLQLDVPLQTMRRDFACIDKHAARSAYEACFKKLVEDRDPGIRHPYRYLLAVARRKNHVLLEDRARARHAAKSTTRILEQERADDERTRREDEDRAHRPERCLVPDLETWVVSQTCCPGTRLGEARLRETLSAVARRIGPAFEAQIAQLADSLPRILDRVRPGGSQRLAEVLTGRFLELARNPQPAVSEPSASSGGLASSPQDEGSCRHVSNLVRQVLDRLRVPHDGTTYVPP